MTRLIRRKDGKQFGELAQVDSEFFVFIDKRNETHAAINIVMKAIPIDKSHEKEGFP